MYTQKSEKRKRGRNKEKKRDTMKETNSLDSEKKKRMRKRERKLGIDRWIVRIGVRKSERQKEGQC